MTLAIRESLTGRLLDTSGTWTHNQQQALLFTSFPEAVTFKERQHLELASVIEYPPHEPSEEEFQFSEME